MLAHGRLADFDRMLVADVNRFRGQRGELEPAVRLRVFFVARYRPAAECCEELPIDLRDRAERLCMQCSGISAKASRIAAGAVMV